MLAIGQKKGTGVQRHRLSLRTFSLTGEGEFGALHSLEQIAGHRFIASSRDTSFIAFMRWFDQCVPEEQIALRCNDLENFYDAVRAGIGMAPLNTWNARSVDQLRQLLPPPEDWSTDLWLVTHRDMHRTRRVQALAGFLKRRLAQLEAELAG